MKESDCERLQPLRAWAGDSDRGQRVSQAVASGSVACLGPSFLTPAKACYSQALIWAGNIRQRSLGREPGNVCPAPNTPPPPPPPRSFPSHPPVGLPLHTAHCVPKLLPWWLGLQQVEPNALSLSSGPGVSPPSSSKSELSGQARTREMTTY